MVKKSIVSGTVALYIALASPSWATVIQHIGNYSEWGTVTWNAIEGLDDADDGVAEQLDFVGDSTSRGAYWGIDNHYVYFRMRLDVGLDPSFTDAHLVLFDVVGDATPDYAFSWDSKSNDTDGHGLEMSILLSSDGTWGGTKMDDIDGNNAKKGTNDINGDGRDTDGYVQTTDGIASDSFGTTTFLDFAVSLSYLSNNVPAMVQNTNWKVQFGSIANATDHNVLSADIAGGQNLGSTITAASWSEAIAIPEPAAATLIIGFGLSVIFGRRIFMG
ncbi:hypothetical protein [Pontiella sp.]|uniref:hypothetical protein n=1 Tax=Pontiella sp. TaxID=2837462 RepID=UPI00356B4758